MANSSLPGCSKGWTAVKYKHVLSLTANFLSDSTPWTGDWHVRGTDATEASEPQDSGGNCGMDMEIS